MRLAIILSTFVTVSLALPAFAVVPLNVAQFNATPLSGSQIQVNFNHGIENDCFGSSFLSIEETTGPHIGSVDIVDPNLTSYIFNNLSPNTSYDVLGGFSDDCLEEFLTGNITATTLDEEEAQQQPIIPPDPEVTPLKVQTDGKSFVQIVNSFGYMPSPNEIQQFIVTGQNPNIVPIAPINLVAGQLFEFSPIGPGKTNTNPNIFVGANQDGLECQFKKENGSGSGFIPLNKAQVVNVNLGEMNPGKQSVSVTCRTNMYNMFNKTISFDFDPTISHPDTIWKNQDGSFGSNGLFESGEIIIPKSESAVEDQDIFFKNGDTITKFSKVAPLQKFQLQDGTIPPATDFNGHGNTEYIFDGTVDAQDFTQLVNNDVFSPSSNEGSTGNTSIGMVGDPGLGATFFTN